MDDASSLRERVHGVTAAAPKTWDESKVKGYDPDYKFDESKVKRDTDPGEEGRFDKKGGGKLSDAEKKRRSFARWYAKQPKEVKEFLAWLNKQPKDVKDWFEKLSKMTAAQRRAYLGLDNLPDVQEMINGRINLRQNLSPEDRAAVERGEATGEDSAGNPLPKTGNPDRKLEEDEVPLKSPSGAKLVDFAGGIGRYEDGSTFDKDGWHQPMKASLTARREAAVKGHALPDGSYPIVTEADWRKALVSCAATPRAVVVEHIRRRGQALGVQGLTASINALTAGYPVGVGKWDETLHPRGRDGKWIEKLGWVSGLFTWERPPTWASRIPLPDDKQGRVQVVGFAANKKDPSDPYVIVKDDETGDVRGYAKASTIEQVASPKGDITPEGEAKQLTLSDAPVQGPPGTRPDLGTPGMNVKQNISTLDKWYAAQEGQPDTFGADQAKDLSDTELDQAIAERERRNDAGDFGVSGKNDLQVLRDEKESRAADIPTDEDRSYKDEPEEGEGDPEATELDEERIANSPDDLYENLYDQPDDLEQFPEAAETPRAESDVAPAQPPTVTRGQFTYSFDEGNWSNAEVWRWNSETGEGEMIGRANLVGDDSAHLTLNGEGKPFPRTFKDPQELLEVAAEKDTLPDTKLGADPAKPKGFGIAGPKVGQKVQVKPGMPDDGKTGTVSKVEKYSVYVDYDDGTIGKFAKGTGIMPASTQLGADPATETELPIVSKREKLKGGWFLEHPSRIKSGWRITHPDFGELPPWKTEDEARAEHARKISGDTKLGAEPDMMHLDEGRFDAQQERGRNLEPFESEEEREQKREELRARVKRMSAKTPVDELAEMREKLRKRVHDKAS